VLIFLFTFSTHPYINLHQPYFLSLRVGHSLILSHTHAVKLYREEFKATQGGQISLVLNGDWQMPYNDNPESKKPNFIFILALISATISIDVKVAQHALDLSIGMSVEYCYPILFMPSSC
jgi:beta-glucosidase